MPLQTKGSKQPLYLVHGKDGDVHGYLGLARLLPPDQPIYGIQALGSDGKATRQTKVEDMAALYAKEIDAFQPLRPIHLGGYSMGGLFAFEVAQQLRRFGRQIAFLALIDSAPIRPISWAVHGRKTVSRFRNRSLFHLKRFLRTSNRDRLSYVSGRWTELKRSLSVNRARTAVTTPPSGAEPIPEVPGFYDYYHAVVSAYRVGRYKGSADVFMCDESASEMPIWKDLVSGRLSFHRVPGGHMQILSPNYVPELTKTLEAALKRAHQNESTS